MPGLKLMFVFRAPRESHLAGGMGFEALLGMAILSWLLTTLGLFGFFWVCGPVSLGYRGKIMGPVLLWLGARDKVRDKGIRLAFGRPSASLRLVS